MSDRRESLYDRADRLRGRRWVKWVLGGLVALVAVRFVWLVSVGGRTGQHLAETVAVAFLPVLFLVAPGVSRVLRGKLRDAADSRQRWQVERQLSAIEVAEREARDPSTVDADAARLFQGDVPSLDAALELYQVANGERVYPRFERLPEAVYGKRVDACVRLDRETPVLCFTPEMLRVFDSDQLLAVIAHLMARADLVRRTGTGQSDGVREADARALLLTRDHVSLLKALETCRTGAVPLASPGDGEAWFSEDEAVPTKWDENGEVVAWERIDRVEDLRQHLGALGMDVPLPPADVRLARLFDVESGTLTPAAKDGLRR